MADSASPRSRTEIIAATGSRPEVILVRSARRTKTVSARMEEDGRIRLMVPASTTDRQAHEYVRQLLPKILHRQQRRSKQQRHFASDDYLVSRARHLVENYLPGLDLPESIRWVENQRERWGSATPARGSVRLSHVLRGTPEYVVDFVLYHELCHFVELNHTHRFRALEDRYPRKLEAEAFLEGLTFARNGAGGGREPGRSGL